MSSSKKQTVGHKHYAGWHAVLAQAGCYLRRIIIDEKEAWFGGVSSNGAGRISRNKLFGGDDTGASGGIVGDFNYYLGGKDQQPDPYLEQQLGIGEVPAYRGLSSFVWKKGYVGNQNSMRDWTYRLSYVNGINPNITNEPTNFVFAFDCSKSLSENDFVRMKNTLRGLANNLKLFKENYFNCKFNVRVMSFDARVEYLDLIDFQVEDALAFDQFIRNRPQVSGNSFSSMLEAGYAFFAQQSDATRNTFCIVADGEDCTPTHTALAQSKFDNVRHFCLYTKFIADNDLTNLPYHIALTKLDNTPEDNWTQGNIEHGYAKLCPKIWTDEGEMLINEEAWFGIRTGEPDMNPADMLWLAITDTFWGLRDDATNCDKVSFEEAWSILNKEDMYMSITFDNEGEAQKIIDLICEHIDAVCQVDQRTGLWTLRLIRDDYVENDLTVLDESNVGYISDFEIRTAAEQVNHITVTYWNKETGKDATTTAFDPARIAMHGLINKSVTYDGFTNEKTAYRAAERDLHALSSPLKSVTLNDVDPDIAKALAPGMAFKWNWGVHGIESSVMRVTSIDYGDAQNFAVKIEAVEDVFKTPMNSVAPYVPPSVDPSNLPPEDNTTVRVIELDYFDAVQFESESTINAALADEPLLSRVAVVAAKNQVNSYDADLMTKQIGDYVNQGLIEYCPSAVLVDAIDRMQDTFAIKNVQNIEQIESNKWALLNDEKVAVVSITETEIVVKRGVNGTIPQLHAAESMILFCDDFIALDQNEYLAGETVYVKALTNTGSNILALNDATKHSITLNAVAIRPYPPANVKINGEYWPEEIETDLIITWVDRNRLTQTGGQLLGFYESRITAESNTLYQLVLTERDENNIELRTQNLSLGTANTFTFATSSMHVNARTIEIVLRSLRDGFDCHQPFVHTIELSTFFSAPYNINYTVS